jgi:hypothetical protein
VLRSGESLCTGNRTPNIDRVCNQGVEWAWWHHPAVGLPPPTPTLMAKQNALGCAILLALIGLVLVLAYWQFLLTVLAVVAVVAIVALVANLVQAQRLARLKTVVESAHRRFAGDVCRWSDRYGLLEAIETTSSPAPTRIKVKLLALGNEDGTLALNQASVPLVPPADLGTIASNLTMAKGNELLEPSIPQLQQALSTFEEEQERLSGYLKESLSMLRKLNDFLSVPETIRPILNFDLDHVFDPGRFQQLEDPFQEVVTLNAVFQDLSRDRLA